MTALHRITIRPRSAWRTPWQADSLAGALLATCARVHGGAFLREKLIDPMLAGQPPFVISDALPGDLLPLPIHLRLYRFPDGTNLKAVKRARWLTADAFHLARMGQAPPVDHFLPDSKVFCESARHHNTLSRLTDTSTDEDEDSAIGLFQKADTRLLDSAGSHLTIYFRFTDAAAGDLLIELLHELSLTGFGADTSTGRGQFDLPNDPTPAAELDSPPNSKISGANGILSLSTFMPGRSDPTDGYWETFAKFPKVGPDIHVGDGIKQRKHTFVLLRPGAVFRAAPATPYLGRAIDTEKLFPPEIANDLLARNLRVIHPAFGVMVPVVLDGE